MSDLINIASLQRIGVTPPPQAPANGLGTQDLLGFLSQIIQQLQGAPIALTQTPADPSLPADLKNLSAKIADILQKSGTLPPELQQLAPEDLAAKIAALIQQNVALQMQASKESVTPDDLAAKITALIQKSGALENDNRIKPSLIRDLVAHQSAEIQEIPEASVKFEDKTENEVNALLRADVKTEDILQKIAGVLAGKNELPPAGLSATTNTKTPDTVQSLPAPSTHDDKIAKIITRFLSKETLTKEDIAQLKAEIAQVLKDQGAEKPVVETYLTALTSLLKTEETPAETPADKTIPLPLPVRAKPSVELDAVKEEKQATAPAAVVAPAVAAETGTSSGNNDNDAGQDLKKQARTAAPAVASKTPAAETAKDVVIRNEKSPEFSAPAATGRKEETPAALSTRQTAAPAPVAQQAQVPPPAQTLSEKIAGFGIHPALINALAHSDGDFSSGGFGADTQARPQDMTAGGALLKPLTVDALNTQNFTNYMTAARNQQNPVTQMVNIQLQHNINAKIDTMTLQLSPAELGRVDIRLKFAKDGSVKAHMTVEKPETLSLLQKDSHHLEKMLRETGLSADENSLSFDLRQQGQQQNLEGFNGRNKGDDGEFASTLNGRPADNALQAKIAIQSYGYITQSGVNIIV